MNGWHVDFYITSQRTETWISKKELCTISNQIAFSGIVQYWTVVEVLPCQIFHASRDRICLEKNASHCLKPNVGAEGRFCIQAEPGNSHQPNRTKNVLVALH